MPLEGVPKPKAIRWVPPNSSLPGVGPEQIFAVNLPHVPKGCVLDVAAGDQNGIDQLQEAYRQAEVDLTTTKKRKVIFLTQATHPEQQVPRERFLIACVDAKHYVSPARANVEEGAKTATRVVRRFGQEAGRLGKQAGRNVARYLFGPPNSV